MQFDLIVIALILIFAFLSQLMVIKGVKFGFMLHDEPDKAAEMPFFNVPKGKPKKPKMTDTDKRDVQILENIMRYDGTSNGQKRIKHDGQ